MSILRAGGGEEEGWGLKAPPFYKPELILLSTFVKKMNPKDSGAG